MKDHFKAGSSPMHLTGTQKADDPHHLAADPGHDAGEAMHLQPGHMMGGGDAGGGAPPMAGADTEPDPGDPNEAAEGESPMGGAPRMGGKKRPGY